MIYKPEYGFQTEDALEFPFSFSFLTLFLFIKTFFHIPIHLYVGLTGYVGILWFNLPLPVYLAGKRIKYNFLYYKPDLKGLDLERTEAHILARKHRVTLLFQIRLHQLKFAMIGGEFYRGRTTE